MSVCFSNLRIAPIKLFIEVDWPIQIFCKVKSSWMEWKLEDLRYFHKLWIDVVSTRSTCFFAWWEKLLTRNWGGLDWKNVHSSAEEVWEPLFNTLCKQVRNDYRSKKHAYCPIHKGITKHHPTFIGDSEMVHQWFMQVGSHLKAKPFNQCIIFIGVCNCSICRLSWWLCLTCVQKMYCTSSDWCQVVWRSCGVSIGIVLLGLQVCPLEFDHLWSIWT